jgi:hypothetical protein
LQAAVVTLTVRNRVSRRDTAELAGELFGVELATGSVDAIIQRAGEALAAPHTRLEQEIKSAPVVNIDETGWKTAGGNRTLWGALSSRTALFRIAAGRHAFEAKTLLGERFAGIVCSDRWRGYDYLDPSNGSSVTRRRTPSSSSGPLERHASCPRGNCRPATLCDVYWCIVARTQIYLGAEERELLDRTARATGASRSELIRRAIRAMYGGRSSEERLAALRSGAGVWKDREFTGAEYVDAIRGDLNERLRRLGLE